MDMLRTKISESKPTGGEVVKQVREENDQFTGATTVQDSLQVDSTGSREEASSEISS